MKKIKLSNSQYTIVDDIDYDHLINISTIWHVDHWGYVVYWTWRNRKNKSIYMAREIAERMGLDLNKETHHKYGEKLDHLRCHLVEATHRQNLQARGAQKNNHSTGHKCITKVNRPKSYKVQIQQRQNGKRKTLYCESFYTLYEAIEARNKKLIEFHGPFAYLD